MLAGAILSIFAGPSVPLPAPDLAEKIDSISVNHSDEGRSTFQIVFSAHRDLPLGLVDYPLLISQRIKIGTRIVLVLTINAMPQVLIDGIVTNQQLNPGDQPGADSITVTGEDLGVLLDQIELRLPFPGNDAALAAVLLAPYAALGLTPMIIPAPTDTPPDPTRTVPHPRGTAWAILSQKAQDHSQSFFVMPGPVPGQSIAYFGPRIPAVLPQRALTRGMGAADNLSSISFQHDGTQATTVVGLVQDDNPAISAPALPVIGAPVIVPPLAALPSIYANAPISKVKLLEAQNGTSWARAQLKAMAETTASTRAAVTASGELDTTRYGWVLYPRQLVGVRGVGLTYDGLYYVKSVAHSIRRGEYKQSFQLSREGTVSTVPMVAA